MKVYEDKFQELENKVIDMEQRLSATMTQNKKKTATLIQNLKADAEKSQHQQTENLSKLNMEIGEYLTRMVLERTHLLEELDLQMISKDRETKNSISDLLSYFQEEIERLHTDKLSRSHFSELLIQLNEKVYSHDKKSLHLTTKNLSLIHI